MSLQSSVVLQKQTLFSGNCVVECAVLCGLWAHCVFYSKAIGLLCWMSMGVSLGAIHSGCSISDFQCHAAPETAHSIKPSHTICKGCKTLSASPSGMQQHWAFPPHMCLKIPNTSPADRNVLGKPHSEQAVFMIKVHGWRWDQADPLCLGWAQMEKCVSNSAVGSWNADIDPAGTAGWMLLLSWIESSLLCEVRRSTEIIIL